MTEGEVTYSIDAPDRLPFGMLNNDFTYPMEINNELWSSCSQYIYVNCLSYILQENSFLNHHREKFLDKMRKSPSYETYQELLETIEHDINYNWYFCELMKYITSYPDFTVFLGERESEGGDILNDVLMSIKENIKIKEYYKYYSSYLVIKVLEKYLVNDLEDFSKIQRYLLMIDQKIDVINEILHHFDFKNIQKLDIYDFETDVSSNSELRKVLSVSQTHPNILFIYVFKYHLRKFKNRIDSMIDNKIFELFLKYKNKDTESIRNEIYLVNNYKLKEIILDQILMYDEKFKRYIDKDETVRMLLNSKITEQKLLEYENFNFYEVNVKDMKKGLTMDDRQQFASFISSLRMKKNVKNIPDNLEKVKMVLATIAIYRKFNLILPQNQVENYRTHLPKFLVSHLDFRVGVNTDLQFILSMTKGLSLVYDTDDETLSKFVGSLLTKLSISSFSFDYEKKVDIKLLFDDTFMMLWLKNQMNYVSHLVSVISLFFDVSNVKVTNENLRWALEVLSDSREFSSLKTKYEDLPASFLDLDYYFCDVVENKQEFLIMIWNFITCNLQTILKTRNFIRTKTILVKYILRLRQVIQCVENLENNDIACLTFCIINVGNKLKRIQDHFKMSINLESYVEAILKNKKTVYDEVMLPVSSSVNDISQIVSQIFSQNEETLSSSLSQSQIVKIVDRLLTFDEDERRNIYVWLNIFSKS